MSVDHDTHQRVLTLLQPFAANWSGTLGRGDLVIPSREIARLVHDIVAALHDPADDVGEASDAEIFQVLHDAQRARSLQDQVGRLRDAFVILTRAAGAPTRGAP